MLHDELRGRGQLEAWERPGRKYEVNYEFEIDTEVVERKGFPRVATRRHVRGTVVSVPGGQFPEGDYRLYAADGEVLKVQNVGLGMWVIAPS